MHITNTAVNAISALNSTILIDGVVVPQEKLNIKKMYDTVMKSGLK